MAFNSLSQLFFLLLLLPAFVVSQTSNITLGSYLVASKDSPSWKSPSGHFAFGFYQLQNQDQFLLAIWFDNIPNRTTVWYANGDNPVSEGSKVELTRDGKLTLTSPDGPIWNATVNGSAYSVQGVAYAALLDTGNFVIVREDLAYAWESFNNPTDTLLPTQELPLGGMLCSKQTPSNYSTGRFQLRMLPDGNLVLNTFSLPKANSFAYNAYYISNTYAYGQKVVFNEPNYISIVLSSGEIRNLTGDRVASQDYYRATLDFDGIFTMYSYPNSQRAGQGDQSWSIAWSIPSDICNGTNSNRRVGDLYIEGPGSCGFNSYCTIGSNLRPSCECLPGFSFSDPNNKFNGCIQDRIQECNPDLSKAEDLYDMRPLPNTFWPTSAAFERTHSNEDECRQSCLYDCLCVVAELEGGLCSKKKLPLTNGMVNRGIDGKAFIKVARHNGPLLQKKDQSSTILMGSFLLGGSALINFLLLTAVSILAIRSCNRRQKPHQMSNSLESNLRSFTYQDLEEATDGFKEELGRGAFGIVYKGVLRPPHSIISIAVKKLDRLMQDGEKEFKTEVNAVAKIHHKNLVTLIGFSEEGPHKLLVYEFMSNGTLASLLYGDCRPEWKSRTRMAFEIARGLVYLHEECSIPIIHCDIKPQNILLDDSFTARISDFGLAKLLMSDQTRTMTATRGTKGYVAPEWFRNTPITTRVDVYSYGVMLLEIICCRKNYEVERENEEEVILTDWVWDCYLERRLDRVVENDEEAIDDMTKVERLVMVAIWCIQEDPSLRPSMRKVTQMLEGVVQVPMPPRPTPFSSVY
ncbi:hypothetical protein SLEP1_g2136 [Rubroshorea leprosula]|uniref:Receptor-like serine/threonine-protein kinase n=1 Tax=Rubroshorea leprosula TaxID=152421 RepID=A0AAV5HND0_9ROSI|nr:hypothetical protein SLEP1_g2136 [Rubroshorea leprosula]